MNVSRLLKDIARPIVRRTRRVPEAKVYDISDAARVNWRAYEDPRIIEIVSKKTAVHKRDLIDQEPWTVATRQVTQDMFVLAYVHPGKALSVVEIGGACGATYFEQNRLQPGRIRAWRVVETPPMVAAGPEFADGRLVFFTDLQQAVTRLAERDLLVAKGVLQYLRDPLGTLEALVRFGFDYIYISRTEVGTDLKSPLIVERTTDLSLHGPGPAPRGFRDGTCTVPAMIVPPDAILGRVAPLYRIAILFEEDGGDRIEAGRRILATRMLGFLAQRIP